MGTLLLLLGMLFLGFSLILLLALFIPGLGRWLRFRAMPATFQEPARRRAAYVQGIADSVALLLWGCSMFAPLLVQHVCAGQEYVRAVRIVAPILAIACSILGLYVARRASIIPEAALSPAARRRASRIGIGLSFVLALLFLWLFSMWPYESFEPVERVQMMSRDTGWAVGRRGFAGHLLQYANGSWQDVATPFIDATDLAMLSDQEGWAVGRKARMLHYQQGRWEDVAVPAGNLNGIAMHTADEGWAVGDEGVILHYTQGRWQQVASPTHVWLQSVAVLPSGEAWVVGGDPFGERLSGVILHYTQGRWQQLDLPALPPLMRVVMVSAQEGWAVGGVEGSPPRSIIMHYRNGNWQDYPQPAPIPLSDIAMSTADEGWAVGGDFYRAPLTCPTSTEQQELRVLLHFVNGTWTLASSPGEGALRGVSMYAQDAGLIVGWKTFLRYDHGTWQQVKRVR